MLHYNYITSILILFGNSFQKISKTSLLISPRETQEIIRRFENVQLFSRKKSMDVWFSTRELQ